MSGRAKPATKPAANPKRPPLVLAIGGFDPSCGAGVVADSRSFEAMGALPLAVVTAITVQSGSGVRGFSPLPTAQVMTQLEELLRNLPVAAIKIGQVPSAALARTLALRLRSVAIPVVLDPVLGASGGGSLVARGAPAAIVSSLVPIVSLLTVNLGEAAALAGMPVTTLEEMRLAARRLEELGAKAVLVKGGHLKGEPIDLLLHNGREDLFRGRRIRGSMHGTGCALASAVAARLARGDDLKTAIRKARRHVRSLLTGAVGVPAARLRPPARR